MTDKGYQVVPEFIRSILREKKKIICVLRGEEERRNKKIFSDHILV